MQMESKQVLITGYNGFVGSNLTSALKDHLLTGIDLQQSNAVGEHYDWSAIQKIKNINCIIHLAGKAHDTSNTSDAQSYFAVNYELTKIVFDYFLESQADKFVFFSSVKAVADTVSGDFLAEGVPPNPLTPYGKSKLAAENYILSSKISKNKTVYILRPCMIHGPGNKGNLNLLYNVIRRGIPYPLGRFNNLRSFTSIDNLIYIIRELIEKRIEPGVYQVCDDDPVSTNELIKLIAQSCCRNEIILNIPQTIIHAIAAAGDLLHLPLNSERLKKLTESYVVSNSKLKSALGINHLPISARDGLIYTFNSFANK